LALLIAKRQVVRVMQHSLGPGDAAGDRFPIADLGLRRFNEDFNGWLGRLHSQFYNFSFVICHPKDDDFGMAIEIHVRTQSDLATELPRFEAYFLRTAQVALSRHPGWLVALQRGLGHIPYYLEARAEEKILGLLPLAYIRS